MANKGAMEWSCSRRPVPRWIFTSCLLAVALLGFCSASRGAQAAELALPGSCVQSPTTKCVMRLSLTAADKISGAHPRAEAFIRIAEAQVESGEISEARSSLSRSLTAAAMIDRAAFLNEARIKTSPDNAASHARAQVFSDIAKILTRLDEKARAQEIFSRALNSAEDIKGGHLRAKTLVEIANSQVAAGALQQARETFAQAGIGRNISYHILLQKIVRIQAEAGDVPVALSTARSIPRGEERAMTLAEIAAVQAAAGDMAGAWVTAKGIEHAYYRMAATHHIGIERAKNGDVAGAWDAVREIVEIWRNVRDGWAGHRDMAILKADTVLAIVKSQIKAGRFGDALAAIEVMEDNFAFVEAHAAVAKAQIRVGALDAAHNTAKAMCGGRYAGHCVEVLAGLAAALGSTGRTIDAQDILSFAQDVAQRLTYYRDRSRAFAALHAAKFKMGDVEGARRAFAVALTAAAGFESAEERAVRFSEMGAAALRAGDDNSATRAFSEALNAASEIKEVNERVEIYVRTGLAQVRTGHTSGARKAFSRVVAVAGAVEPDSWRAELLAGIAFALASGKCEKRTIFSDDPFAICIN